MKIYINFEYALKNLKIDYISGFKDGKEFMVNELFGNEFKHKFRSDYAIKLDNEVCCIVEIEGGTFTKGRHTQGVGFNNDVLKYNAISCKVPVLRFTSQMVEKHPVLIAEFIHKYINDLITATYLSEFTSKFKM